jgi:hypothetical protein
VAPITVPFFATGQRNVDSYYWLRKQSRASRPTRVSEYDAPSRRSNQKLNGIDLEAYQRTVLTLIADHPIKQIEVLLPSNMTAPAS